MVYCDYKRSCKNKGSRCGNCERNYKNEIWEDNYEPKPFSLTQKKVGE